MNSDIKTEKCDKWCKGCETYTDNLDDYWGHDLCEDCENAYENQTGYCSLECCLGGGCDQSC